MSEVTEILLSYEEGDAVQTESLFTQVYDELRRIASCRIAKEPGNSLQATALVHEVFVRLVDTNRIQRWDSLAHFFGAVSEAMRRILIDRARQKLSLKRGKNRARTELSSLDDVADTLNESDHQLLALDDGLEKLRDHSNQAYQLVMLRYFGGLNHQKSAEALGISRRAADRLWAVARVWLHEHIRE